MPQPRIKQWVDIGPVMQASAPHWEAWDGERNHPDGLEWHEVVTVELRHGSMASGCAFDFYWGNANNGPHDIVRWCRGRYSRL